jgi:hypothetical protein
MLAELEPWLAAVRIQGLAREGKTLDEASIAQHDDLLPLLLLWPHTGAC